jgi:hypothetical protein
VLFNTQPKFLILRCTSSARHSYTSMQSKLDHSQMMIRKLEVSRPAVSASRPREIAKEGAGGLLLHSQVCAD